MEEKRTQKREREYIKVLNVLEVLRVLEVLKVLKVLGSSWSLGSLSHTKEAKIVSLGFLCSLVATGFVSFYRLHGFTEV